MTRVRGGPVSDARPPEPLVRAINPVVRTLVRSPFGRRIPALAVIEYRGTRTGRRRRVVVAWHELGGRAFALTPAGWRANFVDGASALVRHSGQTLTMTGSLEPRPETVASTLRAHLAAGGSARSLGLRVAAGHEIDAADVRVLGRSIVWFDPQPNPPSGERVRQSEPASAESANS